MALLLRGLRGPYGVPGKVGIGCKMPRCDLLTADDVNERVLLAVAESCRVEHLKGLDPQTVQVVTG
jgi:hypothetical protein